MSYCYDPTTNTKIYQDEEGRKTEEEPGRLVKATQVSCAPPLVPLKEKTAKLAGLAQEIYAGVAGVGNILFGSVPSGTPGDGAKAQCMDDEIAGIAERLEETLRLLQVIKERL